MTAFGHARAGVTLAELIVVIVILGLIAGMAIQGIGRRSNTAATEAGARLERELLSARSTALRTRRPVVVTIADSTGATSVTALPDGSVIGDSVLLRDRLTGKRRDSVAMRAK